MTPKERRAFEIRDAARRLLERAGVLQRPGHDDGPCLSWRWRGSGIEISWRKFTYPGRTWRPHGIDIWVENPAAKHRGNQMKVMNLEWDDAGDFQILNFKRGEWEEKVMHLAQG